MGDTLHYIPTMMNYGDIIPIPIGNGRTINYGEIILVELYTPMTC